MIAGDQKLNPKLFDKDVEQVPIRKGFGEGVLAAAEKDERVVGLSADLTESTNLHFFAEKFPKRFVQIGIAEQNLVSVASGMAAMGKIPFASSYSMFSPGRSWEQIRTTVCYNNQPVKIVGSHSGVTVGPDGGTHQALEDIAIARVIPRMVIISPCDAVEAKKAALACAQTTDPTYIRLAREKTPVITTAETPFEIGKAEIYFVPKDSLAPQATIIVTGELTHRALEAAKELEEENIPVCVVNLATIKPLDEKTILGCAQNSGAIVTAEEHQIAGGMGSAVAELLAKQHPIPIEFVGVNNEFGQSGTGAELIEYYKMGKKHIKEAVKKVISRKK